MERFPNDFMFQLTTEESNRSRYQIGTLNSRGQNIKYLPYAFTENGVAMLSSVLNSPTAIQVNIQIMRIFTQIRKMLTNDDLRKRIELLERKYQEMGNSVHSVFEAFEEIKRLLNPPPDKKKKIGFI